MTKAVYKYTEDFGRMGVLDGVFVEDVDFVEANTGREVYFGEVLGKHSEIVGTTNQENVTLVADSADFVFLFEQFGLSSGYNPFDCIRDAEDEEE
jgi:hypothetical protein